MLWLPSGCAPLDARGPAQAGPRGTVPRRALPSGIRQSSSRRPAAGARRAALAPPAGVLCGACLGAAVGGSSGGAAPAAATLHPLQSQVVRRNRAAVQVRRRQAVPPDRLLLPGWLAAQPSSPAALAVAGNIDHRGPGRGGLAPAAPPGRCLLSFLALLALAILAAGCLRRSGRRSTRLAPSPMASSLSTCRGTSSRARSRQQRRRRQPSKPQRKQEGPAAARLRARSRRSRQTACRPGGMAPCHPQDQQRRQRRRVWPPPTGWRTHELRRAPRACLSATAAVAAAPSAGRSVRCQRGRAQSRGAALWWKSSSAASWQRPSRQAEGGAHRRQRLPVDARGGGRGGGWGGQPADDTDPPGRPPRRPATPAWPTRPSRLGSWATTRAGARLSWTGGCPPRPRCGFAQRRGHPAEAQGWVPWWWRGAQGKLGLGRTPGPARHCSAGARAPAHAGAGAREAGGQRRRVGSPGGGLHRCDPAAGSGRGGRLL